MQAQAWFKSTIIRCVLLHSSEAWQSCVLVLSHAFCRNNFLAMCLLNLPVSLAACLCRHLTSNVSSSTRCCSVVLSQKCLTCNACCMVQCVHTGCLKLSLVCLQYASNCVMGDFEASGPPSHFWCQAQHVLESAGCDLWYQLCWSTFGYTLDLVWKMLDLTICVRNLN